MSGRVPVASSMRSSAVSITERFRSPRKSIFSRPSSSTSCIAYWVTIGAEAGSAPGSGLRWIGMYSVSGSFEITTAAAWMPSWRRRPSRPRATSITRFASGSASYISRRLVAAT